MEDQPADPGDLTTETRQRRFSLRPKPKAGEPAPAEAAEAAAEPAPEERTEAVDQPKPAPKVPVGKAARSKGETFEEPAPEPAPEPGPGPEAATAEPQEGAPEPGADEEPLQEVTFVPHQPAGKRLLIATAAAGVLFVAAAAFAGATLQPYLAERAEVHVKLDVARAAASAISTLWTYTPENMEALPDRSAGFLGGDFAYEYGKYIDGIVAANKQAQVTNTTEVLGAAVETLTPSEATAIVYTNSVATSPVTKNIPSLRYLSYRLTMQREDAKWLITRMSTVTSLDLTPQL